MASTPAPCRAAWCADPAGEANDFGQPQDIEWAIEAGVLWLLQARPITALPEPVEPVPVPVVPPPGFWEREASHAPQPWTPLVLSVVAAPRNAALRRMFDEFGFLAETLDCQQIGGWEYIRLVPLGGKWLAPTSRRSTDNRLSASHHPSS
jgi:rifampicin phosphotransferase